MRPSYQKWSLRLAIFAMASLALSCVNKTSREEGFSVDREPAQVSNESGISKLPVGNGIQLSPAYLARKKVPSHLVPVLNRYLTFLKLEKYDSKKVEDVADRILQSSMQFLVCRWEDWACLESTPVNATLLPSYRRDTKPDLGKPVLAGNSFKATAYYTKQFLLPVEQRDKSQMLVLELAKKINEGYEKARWDSISAAMYGIDDISASMKPVYEALISAKNNGVSVRAVTDALPGKGDLVEYQYKETPVLLGELGKMAHRECPVSSDIMHNKFLVLQKKNFAAVWTGTANITQTCMGDESNANMALYIEDPYIAKAYYEEFAEMFAPGKCGVFHQKKSPNTKRYFKYADGTEVRVHFSPTDDSEHRAILPAILSAQPNDEIRIAMFGSGGIEYIRALQWAQSRGVKIVVAGDWLTMPNLGSWVNKNNPDRLDRTNPYPGGRPIPVLPNNWEKMNHLKAATFSRNGRAYMLIVGSQNWSRSGNDSNDENNLTIRNMKGLALGDEFNKYFDNIILKNSKQEGFK